MVSQLSELLPQGIVQPYVGVVPLDRNPGTGHVREVYWNVAC